MWSSCTYCSSFFYGTGRFCTAKCEDLATNPPPKPRVVVPGCNFCGKKLEGKKGFCSEECRMDAFKGHLTKLHCVTCNKVFHAYAKTKYCSEDCLVEARERRKKKNYVIGVCRVCGKVCPKDEAVCSWNCAVEYNAV